MRIAPGTRADLDEVVELLLAQLAEHAIHTPRAEVVAALEGVLEVPARGRFFVLRDDAGTALGVAYVSYVWALEHGGSSAWLEELYVRPAERGRGLGGALLDAVIGTLRAEGCIAIDLEVEADHARAENLYVRAGFTRHTRARWVKRL